MSPSVLHPSVERAVLTVISRERIGFDECTNASCAHPSWAHFGFGGGTCGVLGCPCCFLTLPPGTTRAAYDSERKDRLNAEMRAARNRANSKGLPGFR